MCSACAGDYENPDMTAGEVDEEEVDDEYMSIMCAEGDCDECFDPDCICECHLGE
jgi:hypothetical protein